MQITINREEKRNAFTPLTIQELSMCFLDSRDDPTVGVIILTGAGNLAFCSGGDQSVRGKGGYIGADGVPRLNVLDLQMQIRRLPKPVIAMVAGYAVGGGNILQMVCDITVSTCLGLLCVVYPTDHLFYTCIYKNKCRLQQITPSSVRLVRRSGHSMLDMARPTWHAWLDRKNLVKFGFSAGCTMLEKQKKWVWSIL